MKKTFFTIIVMLVAMLVAMLAMFVCLPKASALTIAREDSLEVLESAGYTIREDAITSPSGKEDRLVILAGSSIHYRLDEGDTFITRGTLEGASATNEVLLCWGKKGDAAFLYADTCGVIAAEGTIKVASLITSEIVAIRETATGAYLDCYSLSGTKEESTLLTEDKAKWIIYREMLYGISETAAGLELLSSPLPDPEVTRTLILSGEASLIDLAIDDGRLVLVYKEKGSTREAHIIGDEVVEDAKIANGIEKVAFTYGVKAYSTGSKVLLERENGTTHELRLEERVSGLSFVNGYLVVSTASESRLYNKACNDVLSFPAKTLLMRSKKGRSIGFTSEADGIHLHKWLDVRLDDYTNTTNGKTKTLWRFALGLEENQGVFPKTTEDDEMYGYHELLETITIDDVTFIAVASLACELVVNVSQGESYDVPYVLSANAFMKLDGVDFTSGNTITEEGSHVLECISTSGEEEVISFQTVLPEARAQELATSTVSAQEGTLVWEWKDSTKVRSEFSLSKKSALPFIISLGVASLVASIVSIVIWKRIRRKKS